jgi:hypothetical protein
LKYSAEGTAAWAAHGLAASDVGAVPTSRTISTTAPLSGGGALSGNLTLTHSDGAGYKHVPSGGATGQFLKYGGASGTAVWGDVPGGLELGETEGTAYRGDRGKTAYDHSQTAHLALGNTSATAHRGDHGETAYDHSQAATGAEHGATAAATANMLCRRDASGRIAVADPSESGHAATKNYVDTLTQTRTAILTAAGAIPQASGGPAKTLTTGTNHTYYALAYDKATDEHAFFNFTVPQDFQAGNVTVKVLWIAEAATSGAAVWNVATLGRQAGEAWDAALGSVQSVTSTTNGTAKNLNAATFTAFNPGWAAGDLVVVKVSRDADHASDTLDADALLICVEVQYTGK